MTTKFKIHFFPFSMILDILNKGLRQPWVSILALSLTVHHD